MKFNSKTGSSRFQSGFTLVELLVAIFLFSLAFTATTFVLTLNLGSATSIKNSFVASGLAQEGIEVARNLRDNDWFSGSPFGTSIPNGTYIAQWNSQALAPVGSNPNIKFDGASGLFSYGSGTDTIFNRSLTIDTVTPGVEKRVVVIVSWQERSGSTKTVSAEEHLFNWK